MGSKNDIITAIDGKPAARLKLPDLRERWRSQNAGTAVQLTLKRMTEQLGAAVAELRGAVEGRLDLLRVENAEKLELMRQTVDEKLQGTLEQRLGASFKMVNDSLAKVHASVGEMQLTMSVYIFGLAVGLFLCLPRGRAGTWGAWAMVLFGVTVAAMGFATWQQRRAEKLTEVRPEQEGAAMPMPAAGATT